MKTYETHDNGGRPFCVEVEDDEIHIYSQLWDEENEYWAKHKLILKTSYQRIFIGDNDLQLHQYKKKGLFPGNSILIQISSHQYVFIGTEVFRFETDDELLEYYSPIGNSDVSYPYAIGTEWVYFFIESMMIPQRLIHRKEDGYTQFYGHDGRDPTEWRNHIQLEQRPFHKTILCARLW